MILQELENKKLIKPPKWLVQNTMYLTISGGLAYATSTDSSDYDMYGICIPDKQTLFPHLSGEIYGFGKQKQRFEQYQQHHIHDKDALGGRGRDYDISIYNIVKFFNLLMDNNPSCIDVLFTPQECILHQTEIGQLIRDNRNIFLHKGLWHRFKGYSYSMLHKMKSKTPEEGSKRKELVEKYGFDTKFAMNVVRILNEAEQLLATGELDLRLNCEQHKAIKRGEVPMEKIIEYFSLKEKQLEELYHKSSLPYGPDESKIKQLLIKCLEMHYGKLGPELIVNEDKYLTTLREIQEKIEGVL